MEPVGEERADTDGFQQITHAAIRIMSERPTSGQQEGIGKETGRPQLEAACEVSVFIPKRKGAMNVVSDPT